MKRIWRRYHKFILPVTTAGLALLLALSLLFPKKVLDTYEMNLSREGNEEKLLSLSEGNVIAYRMNTGTRPLRGIQPGISLQGGQYEKAVVRCRVYTEPGHAPVSDNEYPLAGLTQSVRESGAPELYTQAQYMYIPFSNFEDCLGDITVEFTYESKGEIPRPFEGQDGAAGFMGAPGLLVNDAVREGTETQFNGSPVEGGLAGYYVYTHNMYPLVYDLRILLVIFTAAWAAQGAAGKSDRRTGKSYE